MSVQGAHERVDDQAALAALCAAVDRAVQAYRPEGFKVREVVVMLEEGSPDARRRRTRRRSTWTCTTRATGTASEGVRGLGTRPRPQFQLPSA